MFYAPALTRAPAMGALQPSADDGFQRFFRSLLPAFHDVQEDDRSWTVTLDVPGVRKDQLQVSIVGNTVSVETVREAARQVRASYQLPNDIDAEKSEARLEDGVLTLRLAKVESATARRITVQ